MDSMQQVYEAAPVMQNGNALWKIIRNSRRDRMEELSEMTHGRRQTSKYGVMEYLENDSVAWKDRVKIDVVIGLLARAMRLGDNDASSEFRCHLPGGAS